MQYFAQDEATRLDPDADGLQTLAGDLADRTWFRTSATILGGFLFSGDDIEKPVRVLSGGERTRLAVARMLLRPVQHASPRRADQPPRSRLEGRPARGARRLRRHADLRLARSLFRGSPRHQGHRGRRRRGRRLSRHVRGVPVEPEEPRGGRCARGHGRWARATAEGEGRRPRGEGRRPRAEAQAMARGGRGARTATVASGQPAEAHARARAGEGGRTPAREAAVVRRKEARGLGSQEVRKEADARQRRIQDLEARIAEREEEVKAIEAADVSARLLREPRSVAANHRSSSDADVGGRRSHEPVGGALQRDKTVIAGQKS